MNEYLVVKDDASNNILKRLWTIKR